MKVLPTNGYVLCKKVSNDKNDDNKSFFIYGLEDEEMPVYEVVEFSPGAESADFYIGDKVIASSSPTKVKLSETEQYYLIKLEHIAGTIS